MLLDQFWRRIEWRTSLVDLIMAFIHLWNAEIDKLDIALLCIQDVLGFDIHMQNVFRM